MAQLLGLVTALGLYVVWEAQKMIWKLLTWKWEVRASQRGSDCLALVELHTFRYLFIGGGAGGVSVFLAPACGICFYTSLIKI